MQGDFAEMQGGGIRSPVKNCQISKAWMGISLLEEQGGYPSLAGNVIRLVRVDRQSVRESILIHQGKTMGRVRSDAVRCSGV